ncbi:MAG: hypothetical protein LKE51_13600 [Selenomonas sp.]|nr:hypothetical protein [Selenomonas sp.]
MAAVLPKDTFKYSRLISHVHYMLLRIQRGEVVSIDINDYVAKNFPRASADCAGCLRFYSR